MMSFINFYFQQIQAVGFVPDPGQLEVVSSLDELTCELASRGPSPDNLLSQLRRLTRRGGRVNGIQGRYIWGGVGRGKTWLMDLFYRNISTNRKLRLHYQEFMQQIHLSLDQEKGHKDPLDLIAKRFAGNWSVICLDEFFVSDITDAMLLHGLLLALRKYDVCLILTSNVPPDALYNQGLQRDRFLPAIELIKNELIVLELDGDKDFRRPDEESEVDMYLGVDEQAQQQLRSLFMNMVGPIVQRGQRLLINKRYMQTQQMNGKVVWFEFDNICGDHRSASDYIELANKFSTVIISNVPTFSENNEDRAYRFIQLIDEMYDRHVRTIVTSATSPRYLYKGRRYQFEFQRTVSRLAEMQRLNNFLKAV